MSTSGFTICREGGHAGRALGCMASFRRANTLCDVTIQVEGQQFEAHRVVLAASSAYFRAMFGGKLEESRQKVVTIHNIPAAILGQLIDYCYTSAIEVTEDNVQVLLTAAGVLQFGWVQEVACEFLKRRLDATNCLGIAALADIHSCPDLRLAAESVALQNFLEVVEGTEFYQLPVEELAKLISSDELNVQREEQVYEAVMKWIHHDLNARKLVIRTGPVQRRYCGELLCNVRLPLLERNYLVTTVGADPLIRGCEQCRDLLDEAKDFLLLPEKRSALEGPRTRPRHQMHCNEVLYAVGGWCNGDAISTVERYSSHSDGWKVMATMTKRRCGVGVVSLNNLLYAVCGHDGNSYLNSVECYEPKTNQWSTRVAPTGYCRTSVGVAVLDGHIYAVGGQDGLSCLNIVERYDPKSNKWQQVSSMAYRRLGAGVAALNGCLYAVGGSDGNVPLASVERYDPGSEQWTAVASMAVHRKHLGVGVLDGILYAVGGRNEATELSSVERYDPVLDQWSSVVAMTCSRSGVGLAVVNNRLFAVGGFDGSSYLKSVEWLDQSANQWRLAGNMSYRRLGCGVGVLRVAGST